MKKEMYNIQDGAGMVHRISVHRSEQHSPGERMLYVGGKSKAWKLRGPCHAADPTPWFPRIIFSLQRKEEKKAWIRRLLRTARMDPAERAERAKKVHVPTAADVATRLQQG